MQNNLWFCTLALQVITCCLWQSVQQGWWSSKLKLKWEQAPTDSVCGWWLLNRISQIINCSFLTFLSEYRTKSTTVSTTIYLLILLTRKDLIATLQHEKRYLHQKTINKKEAMNKKGYINLDFSTLSLEW